MRGCCALCCWRAGFRSRGSRRLHVVEVRTLGRLYCTLMDERRAWQQRIHAQLFHQGCPPIRALLSVAGRDALARAELSAAGRQYVDTALRRIDELTVEIGPLRAQLVTLPAARSACQALQARQYGIGWLCAAIIWAEIGDARRFSSSDQLVRFAGLDVTVYSSDGKRSPGHLSRQGSPGAAVGDVRGGQVRGPARFTRLRLLPPAGDQARRPQRQEPDPGGGAQDPAPLLSHAARTRRCRPGAAHPRGGGRLTMRCARALPIPMPAASSRKVPVATPLLGGLPGKNERPHPFTSPHVGHPIHHHVAGPSSVDPDKAGRRHAQRRLPHHVVSREGRR